MKDTSNIARNLKSVDFYDETDLEKASEKLEEMDSSGSQKHLFGINKSYLVPKFFYFFFLSGQGSLLPYLSLFFKELELSASQVGIISGIKPYIAFICIPLWGALADRYKKSRLIFVISLLAIAAGMVAIALVPVNLCDEQHLITKPSRTKRNSSDWNPAYVEQLAKMTEQSFEEAPWPLPNDPSDIAFKSEDTNHKNIITRSFVYLLMVTILSTIFACPGLTIADHATVQLLKDHEETHTYGKQRLWGSFGYGMTAFLVGAAVSKTHLCPPGNSKRKDVNYYPCFYVHTVCILAALAVGVRYKFDSKKDTDSMDQKHSYTGIHLTDEDEKNSLNIDSAKTSRNSSSVIQRDKKTQHNTGVENGLRQLVKSKHIMFFATAFYVGITMGLIKVFLFWHLKDLGGTQLLFSIMSAINSTAEVLVYFLSSKLIASIGYMRVIYLGLVCYSLRLFSYALIRNPWYVLTVEPLSGVTTAGVWAAMMTYVGHNSVDGASVIMQGKP